MMTELEAATRLQDEAFNASTRYNEVYKSLSAHLGSGHPLTLVAYRRWADADRALTEARRNVQAAKPKPFNEGYWTTGDGRRIQIKHMENDHLINVIWWVHQHLARYGEKMLQGFVEEAARRKLAWTAPIPYKHYNNNFR